MTYLTAPPEAHGAGWPAQHVHWLGFAQGGSAMLEALRTWDGPLFGSALSVEGPLLSLPATPAPRDMPLCVVTRFSAAARAAPAAREQTSWPSRVFQPVTYINLDGPPNSMVRGAEWPRIIHFWSQHWRQRSTWELRGEVVPLQP